MPHNHLALDTVPPYTSSRDCTSPQPSSTRYSQRNAKIHTRLAPYTAAFRGWQGIMLSTIKIINVRLLKRRLFVHTTWPCIFVYLALDLVRDDREQSSVCYFSFLQQGLNGVPTCLRVLQGIKYHLSTAVHAAAKIYQRSLQWGRGGLWACVVSFHFWLMPSNQAIVHIWVSAYQIIWTQLA